jgi:hypothetical protein
MLKKVSRYAEKNLVHKILVDLSTNNLDKMIFSLLLWNIVCGFPISINNVFTLNKLIIERYLYDSENITTFFEKFITTDNLYAIFLFQKLSTALGFFTISLKFHQKYLSTTIKRAYKVPTLNNLMNGIKASIAAEDLVLTKEFLSRCRNIQIKKEKHKMFFSDLSQYIQFCDNLKYQSINNTFPLNVIVYGKDVLIIGPSDTTWNFSSVPSDDLIIIRKIAVRADSFQGEKYEKFDIAYTDNYYFKEKINIRDWMTINGVKLIITNALVSDNKFSIVGHSPNRLFVSGGANRLQFMIFDLIFSNPNRVFIDGNNFYANKSVYADSGREIDHIGNQVNMDGSTLIPYSLCNSLAEHNIFVNRSFFKNLCRNSIICLSDEMRSIIDMTNEEFALTLDTLHGKHKLN